MQNAIRKSEQEGRIERKGKFTLKQAIAVFHSATTTTMKLALQYNPHNALCL